MAILKNSIKLRLLIILSLFCYINSHEKARELLKSLYGTIEWSNITDKSIGDKCLGADADRDFSNLLRYIEGRNYEDMFNTIIHMYLHFRNPCKIDNISSISRLLKELVEKDALLFIGSLIKHSKEIESLIINFQKNKSQSGGQIGEVIGKILNVIIRDYGLKKENDNLNGNEENSDNNIYVNKGDKEKTDL